MLAALRSPETCTPGCAQDIAVRAGPFIERAHTRPGDNHGTEMIAVALLHPDTPHAAAYLHGHQLGNTDRDWLRHETTAILGTWQPAYPMPTHATANPPPPDDIGGPYTQTWLASLDADRLNTELEGRAALVIPGFTVTAKETPFDVSDHENYADPHGADVAALLADAVAGVRA
ncbi:hypothetical protein GCM10020000_84420 [Streptomyces olivoverticillatus]